MTKSTLWLVAGIVAFYFLFVKKSDTVAMAQVQANSTLANRKLDAATAAGWQNAIAAGLGAVSNIFAGGRQSVNYTGNNTMSTATGTDTTSVVISPQLDESVPGTGGEF